MRALPLLLALLLALPAASSGVPPTPSPDAWALAREALGRAHLGTGGLDDAKGILATLDAHPGWGGAAQVAHALDAQELARLGRPMPTLDLDAGLRPSDAAALLLAAHGTSAPGLQRLDGVPALARVLTAYLAFEDATREAFRGLRSEPVPRGATLLDLGVDEPRILAARQALLDASLDLARTWHPDRGCEALQVAPVLSIELGACDRTYTEDFALVIDAGGDDLYLNNAGGNAVGDLPCAGLEAGRAAALIDLGGDDSYASGRGCGVHGGARLGAGFLLDASGDDTYDASCCDFIAGGPVPGHDDPCTPFVSDCCANEGPPADKIVLFPAYWYPDAPGGGTNGGAQTGLGFLLDGAGDDTYLGGDRGTNGGGATVGVGLLLDLSGNDRYTAGDLGTNGGSWWGHAIFVDAAGDDTYLGGSNGTNGGTYDSSAEFIDAGGNDVFRAGDEGVNGGSWGGTTVFINRNGDDVYEAGSWGVNGGIYYGGAGLFVETDGNDRYQGGDYAVNGGTCSGATVFVDGSGNDAYLAGSWGTNGGAYLPGGDAQLVDGSGNDVYRAGHHGTNGGAYTGALGMLLDLGGNDDYTALDVGANGGYAPGRACRGALCADYDAGRGLLLDLGGRDTYHDAEGGSGLDVSVAPKGLLGMQLDLATP